MQLLRLEMKGFKSFADKTIVNFSPGMTAIVGPNGSGKSNITDAMKWVLGESNVRNLRGQKAEDIIFAGTEKRRPLGAAEVTLVFDNTDRGFSIDMAEVAITRRIYRSGESEFFINKRACRLKDIHLLLADTGLGRDSMAIIGQNRIDAILNSKPEERRLIFEEVAGISRFKLNKEDAIRRIHATERNMERLADLISSLEEQLGPLAEKAEKTERYMALSRQKRQYDGALAFHNYKTADRLFTKFENDNITYQSEAADIQTELTKLETKRQKLQLETANDQEQLKLWEADYNQLQREEERLSGSLRLIEEKVKTGQRDLEDTKLRLSELQAVEEAENQQVILLQELIKADQVTLADYQGQLQELEAAYVMAQENLLHEQAQLQAYQDEVDSRQEQYLQVLRLIETTKIELQHSQGQVADLEASNEIEQKELQHLEEGLLQAEADYQKVACEFEQVQNQCQLLAEQEQGLLQELRERQKQAQKSQAELQKTQGRLDILESWAEQHEGYAEGTKNVLKGQGSWRKDIRGALGDLFDVADPYVTAIDTALGASINHVVTTSAQAASEAVKYLKATQGGRVTFLPMETVRGRLTDTPALQEAGVVGAAVDCLSFAEEYRGIFNHLLGRTLVVETMERAIEIQKRYKQQLRIVTLTGEQLQPGGSLTGGTNKRRKASVLSRKEERYTLEKRMLELQSFLSQWEQEQESQQEKWERLHQDKQIWEDKRQHLNLLQASGQAQVENEKRQVARKQEGVVQGQKRYEAMLAEVERLTGQLAEQERQLASLTEVKERGASMSQLMAKLPDLQNRRQETYEAFTSKRLSCQNLEESIALRKTQLLERQKTLASVGERRGPLQDNLTQYEKRLEVELPQEQNRLHRQWQETRTRASELKAQRDSLYQKTAASQSSVESTLADQQDLQRRQKVIHQRLLDMESRLTRYKLDCERYREEVHNLGFTMEEAQVLQLKGSVADWKAVQARLLGDIAALGPVNPNAVEEFQEAKDKYEFLQGQTDDLSKAKEQLQSVIEEMDKAMSTQLIDVIDTVGQRFQEVFAQLFGGGTAQIVLTDPDNILSGGIDFYIQPPGKKRQQLTLLSGGERALTVLALLFSFLDYRPAPFCVLDEVDAALDEANVERFSHYLNALDHTTQFIVVSHRKKTMEAAEILQGVTMVERGVSRLLTVTFDDVKEDMT